MKQLMILLVICISHISANSQAIPLKEFNKIKIGPKINLVLQEGGQEDIIIEYKNVEPHEIIYEVQGKTLKIFLEGAKFLEPQTKYRDYNGNRRWTESIYRNAEITAFVTYKTLKTLEVRGEEDVTLSGPSSSDALRLRLFGETDIQITDMNVDILKATLYGGNDISIVGEATEQIYKLYGENEVDCIDLPATYVKATSYGDNEIKVNAEAISLTAFGDTDFSYVGPAFVDRKIVIGDTRIRQIK